MTVESPYNKISYTADGIAAAFAYDFLVFEEGHMNVFFDGDVYPGNFTITGLGNPGGGIVTLADVPDTGVVVTLYREVPVTQETDYEPYSDFPANQIERDYDLGVMADQQLLERVGRSLSAGIGTDPNVDYTLPAPEADKTLGWNETGDGLTNLLSAQEIGDFVTTAAAEADRATTEADRATGQADTATTEANRAATEADRAATEANRAVTEADRAVTEADRAETEADRATTEADRAKDEADRISKLLVEAPLSGTSVDINFDATGYDRLQVEMFVVTTGAQNSPSIRFNGDTGNNYISASIKDGTESYSTSFKLGTVPTGSNCLFVLEFINEVIVNAMRGSGYSSGIQNFDSRVFLKNNATVVNTINVIALQAMASGSYIKVYGRN